MKSRRIYFEGDPFPEPTTERAPWEGRGAWPCFWIGAPSVTVPCVYAYRKHFTLTESATVLAHVSADERYDLHIDGTRIGRGSERGDVRHWCFESYEIVLEPGPHVIVAKVWSLGAFAPVAQMTLRHGFIFAPDDPVWIPILGTGIAEWDCKEIKGFTHVPFPGTEGAGARVILDGSQFAWGVENGSGDGWQPSEKTEAGASFYRRNDYGPVHLMKPATLPPMLEKPWTKLVVRQADSNLEQWMYFIEDGAELTIPPLTKCRVLVDLEDYVCAYPELMVSGGKGGSVSVFWSEALQSDSSGRKGNRDKIEGKLFVGVGDVFETDGTPLRKYETFWWAAGRYVEIVVQTAADPLTLHRFNLQETRYPLEMESLFAASDPRLAEIIPLMLRSLQTCLHETYMDCPFYEQLMYAGDTRTQVLTTYTITRDSLQPRKALELFAASQLPSGLTQSRYPSRGTQIIPPFALWWVAMVHDHAWWRGDVNFIRSLMPTVRHVMDAWLDLIGPDGLAHSPIGWNFTDWVNGWEFGVPPGGNEVSGVLQWHLVMVLKMVEKLEQFCGRPELAGQAQRFAGDLAIAAQRAFWKEDRGLFADDPLGRRFSEHAQSLAVLSGFTTAQQQAQISVALLNAPNLARTGIYFSHYLFDAFFALRQPDAVLQRLTFWFDLKTQGFKTTPETADPCRSDNHAWGAHPLHHYFSSFLGIRPASMGFVTVRISPQLGSLSHISGKMVHPLGEIEADFRIESGRLVGTVALPAGLTGEFVFDDTRIALHEGLQTIC